MTAKANGNTLYTAQKIYMPQSTESKGENKMVYAPFRKVGIFRDTSLQPNQTKTETFEIVVPYKDVEKDGKKIREFPKEIVLNIELWYLPAGAKGVVGKDQFLFHKTEKHVVFK